MYMTLAFSESIQMTLELNQGRFHVFRRTVNTEQEKLRIKSALIGPSWPETLIALNLFRLQKNSQKKK